MSSCSSGTTNRAIELIKCFCGCSEVSRRDVERILMSNIESNVRNEQVHSLFKSFIKLEHRHFQPPALKAMLCYELCDSVRQNGCQMDEDTYEEIKDLCPLHRLENQLEEAYETDPAALPDVLETLMQECGFFLERTTDYKRFLNRLRDKVK